MNYFYDENNVRYTLASTQGGKAINWLFLPGGPGIDSSYFISMIEIFNLPGNVWLIDLPGNGSHQAKIDDFDQWFSIFIPVVERFTNPVLVGHSFGGMFPLLFPELEKLLYGLVILNSAPSFHLGAAYEMAKERQLPDISVQMQAFIQNPSQETYSDALNVCMPYYFPPHSLERGRKLLGNVTRAVQPALWWLRRIAEAPYNASWVPQDVKTLIIGGEFDAITPYAIFKNDARFDRPNIEKVCIKNAGHFPVVEAPEIMKTLFKTFEDRLSA